MLDSNQNETCRTPYIEKALRAYTYDLEEGKCGHRWFDGSERMCSRWLSKQVNVAVDWLSKDAMGIFTKDMKDKGPSSSTSKMIANAPQSLVNHESLEFVSGFYERLEREEKDNERETFCMQDALRSQIEEAALNIYEMVQIQSKGMLQRQKKGRKQLLQLR